MIFTLAQASTAAHECWVMTHGSDLHFDAEDVFWLTDSGGVIVDLPLTVDEDGFLDVDEGAEKIAITFDDFHTDTERDDEFIYGEYRDTAGWVDLLIPKASGLGRALLERGVVRHYDEQSRPPSEAGLKG